ncbi:MAG: glucuronate isomerase [Alicyclobacillus sp.]|nr:glucuronate isomerase [Alicyclobacillus sp.]
MPQHAGGIGSLVKRVVDAAKVVDMHTHLFAPAFGDMLLCGADEVLSFHYLVSESFRVHRMPFQAFWAMPQPQRAELVWKSLFVDQSPLSEAASGVVAIAKALGCDTENLTLDMLREVLPAKPSAAYIEKILTLAGVDSVVMTNDPFDATEHAHWMRGIEPHDRFHAALRLDQLVNHYATAAEQLRAWGYDVRADLSGSSFAELRRWLEDWLTRTQSVYVAFSAADDFAYPHDGPRGRILDEVLLPVLRDRKLPLSLMIGARRRVNPGLREAGDSLAQASLRPVERLCAMHPDNKFLVTMLSRENQHELVVTARKFHNLMIFGCWWFVNTDTLVDEITRMRLELLGPTFIPQHSDARVLEHLIYKWQRARNIVTRVLTDKYSALAEQGWTVTEEAVQRDVNRLFRDNFWEFVKA